jgi:hypothetical protein
VITDFSDLEKIGHSHYIHLCDGSDVTEDLEYLDGADQASSRPSAWSTITA